jgi:NTE family protein
VATSTALPPLLTPISFENRGGTCGRKAPAWQAAAEAAIGESETPGRALLRARALQSYTDPSRPYVHVFDGGLSENLGLAELIRAFEILRVDPDVLPALRRARKIVVIAVNALRFPEVDWDRSDAPPDTDTLTDQMWSIPVDRITLDGVEQVRDKLAAWQAGSPERRAYLTQVTFENLKDPAERRYFKGVKTRLQLPKEQTDKVREVGARLLREAPAFQRLLADLKSGR